MKRILSVLFAVVWVCWAGSALAAVKCVFIGDSITLGARLTSVPVTPLERFSYLISQKRGCIEVNKGVGSDVSTGMLARFEKDVVANSPAWVGIMTGTNDAYPPTLVPLSSYERNMRAMIERSLQIGAKVVIFTPPVTTYADTQAIIQPYLQVLRKLAPLYRGTYLVDVHQAFAEKKIYDPPSFSSLLMDPWHPTVAGHQFIADLLDLPQYQAAFRIDGTKEVTSDIHSQKPSDR